MDSKQITHFFNNVMVELKHYDWKIIFNNDNYCWIKNKIITIDLNYDGDVRQIILHEIAHINTAKYCNQKHNLSFWKELEYLTQKFLKKDLDENQKRHKQWMTIGIYKLCYKNK